MSNQEFLYTIEDLAKHCQVTKQSIYNLARKNQDFINDNSRKRQRRVLYNQAVFNFFADYYEKSTASTSESNASVTQDTPNTATPQAEVKALQAEVDRLTTLLAEKEAERKQLLNQVGALILTLQQEKQEKMMLLPAPRKGIGETIKGWFRKD